MPRLTRRVAIAALAAATFACTRTTTTTTTVVTPASKTGPTMVPVSLATNPLAFASTLYDQAPPFDRIHDADYQPAIEEGIREERAEIAAIAAQSAAPTFDNTIVAMERAGQLLTRATKVFFGVVGANTNDTLDKVQEAVAPELAALNDAIYLDPRLFARVKSLYDRRDALSFAPEQKRLVEQYYRNFVHAGANLSDADKTTLRALNQEESKLSTQFITRLIAATKAGALVVDDSAQLRGLSAAEIKAASDAAARRHLDGKYVIPLQNTTQQPAQAELQNRDVRQRLFEASTRRADRGDSNDTRAIVRRLAQLRAQKAALFGQPSYAAYALETQVAKTPEAASALLGQLVAPAVNKAHGEAAAMQALIDQQHGGFKLAPWDWQYYAEQVRKAQYDLDESQIKPYFLLDTVLVDGVFYAANRMYGLTFKERKDLPVYQPDVRVFEVFDADGKPLALWYCDYFKRDNKGGGAWEDSFVDQSRLMGTKAVVFNVANFSKPSPGDPALLTFDDGTTMFHEFGHALHAMFSNVEYPSLSGTNVPRDFVEFPSQFNEHWALEPSVFAHYAKHYRTGAPMPQSLVDRIKKARTFNQGFATTEYLAAALLDLAWHSLPASAPPQDVEQFEKDALAHYHIDVPEVPPRYRTPYFQHIWSGGYSAGYYAYMWSEVLDDDAYSWFVENGGMTRANGQRFRDMVLSRGGTEDAAALFRAFRGRDPKIEPLLEARGLVAGTP